MNTREEQEQLKSEQELRLVKQNEQSMQRMLKILAETKTGLSQISTLKAGLDKTQSNVQETITKLDNCMNLHKAFVGNIE